MRGRAAIVLLALALPGCSRTYLEGSRDASPDSVDGPDEVEGDGEEPLPLLQTTSSRFHSCAWMPTGPVLCWGRNAFGELGDGSRESSAAPVAVVGLEDVVQVSAGGATDLGGSTCALLPDGTVGCWGSNYWGQLGDGSWVEDRPLPAPVPGISHAAAIDVGPKHACALLIDGSVACWGFNRSGQLGDGTRTDSPVPVTVAALEGAVQIAVGSEHTCARLGDGAVFCWGHGGYGELGNGTTTAPWIPRPDRVLGLDDAVEISAGGFSSCARRASGQVVCWGNNEYGGLGDGTLIDRTTPVPVVGLTDATALSRAHCALRSGGTVACWGSGVVGQLGNGSWDIVPSPVAVVGLDGVLRIAGESPTCAVTLQGDLFCWGPNEYGQVGDGTTENRNIPVSVAVF